MALRSFVLMVVLLSQSTQPPTLLGELARALSAKDISDAVQLASACRSPAWLIIGHRGQVGTSQYLEVFCPPDVSTTDLRRGVLVSMARSRPSDVWISRETQPAATYAQVRVTSRSFDAVQNDDDMNRPFRVAGTFTDDELVKLVTFIRSSPTWSGSTVPTKLDGTRPIGGITRYADGSIGVAMWRDEWSGQTMKVSWRNGAWVVLSIGFVIA